VPTQFKKKKGIKKTVANCAVTRTSAPLWANSCRVCHMMTLLPRGKSPSDVSMNPAHREVMKLSGVPGRDGWMEMSAHGQLRYDHPSIAWQLGPCAGCVKLIIEARISERELVIHQQFAHTYLCIAGPVISKNQCASIWISWLN
jgi:hypothetical protein